MNIYRSVLKTTALLLVLFNCGVSFGMEKIEFGMKKIELKIFPFQQLFYSVGNQQETKVTSDAHASQRRLNGEKINYDTIFRPRVWLLGANLDSKFITLTLQYEKNSLYPVGDIKRAIVAFIGSKYGVSCSVDSIDFINEGRILTDDKIVNRKQLTELTTNIAVIKNIPNSGTGRK